MFWLIKGANGKNILFDAGFPNSYFKPQIHYPGT
jgi:hypothetical protein